MDLLILIVIVIALIGYIGHLLNSRSPQEAGAKMQETAARGWGCLGCGLKGFGWFLLIVAAPTLILMILMLFFGDGEGNPSPPIAKLLGVAIIAGVVWWLAARGRSRS